MITDSESKNRVLLNEDLTTLFSGHGFARAPIINVVNDVGFSPDIKMRIDSDSGSYFVRCYKTISIDQLNEHVDLLTFLDNKGFPVPQIYSNNQGGKVLNGACGKYIVYEFIDGYSANQPNGLTDDQLITSAMSLAQLHDLTENYSSANSGQTIDLHIDPNKQLAIIGQVLRVLDNKDKHDPNDEIIIAGLSNKIVRLEGVKEFPRTNTAIAALRKVFTHGDYHGGNIIFDSGSQSSIQSIVDWEDAGWWMRAAELQASISMMCKQENTDHFNVPLDFRRAQIFLDAYEQVSPLTKQEKALMPYIALFDSLRLDFLLINHYLKGRDMSAHFPRNPIYWTWWEDNVREYAEEVLDVNIS